ncbi:PIN domain-containing protein [Mesorhizobium xinjiangense]|uniref:PIN domain-containing protein n=1 Tax=Mesorhizobium xinjiangense TaxID=2678685 RepID=UPI0012EE0CAF|nr:PIN domain-containing protein [Mesorhizobium xinjiangense]
MSVMPATRVFIDSTTLLYTLDSKEPKKRLKAAIWLTALAEHGITNLQVLNEVTNVLTKKRARFDDIDVSARVDNFSSFGKRPLTWHEVLHARRLHERHGYAWWDCLLLASALDLGCELFLSEDLQDGQVIEGLTIVDPFAHSPERILVS